MNHEIDDCDSMKVKLTKTRLVVCNNTVQYGARQKKLALLLLELSTRVGISRGLILRNAQFKHRI